MAWHEGGCHCGAVRFRVRIDAWEAVDCNCSICRRKGILHLIVQRDAFELLRGEEALTEYRFGTRTATHRFCRVCGIHPFYTPRSHPDGVDVNARCLDEDLSGQLTIRPFDGQNWEERIDGLLER